MCQWRNHWTQSRSELREMLQSQQSEPIAQALVSWCIFALVRYCASGGITEHSISQSWEKGCNPNSLSPLHRPWWAGMSLLWCSIVLVEESLNTASVRAERKAAVPVVWARCTGPGELPSSGSAWRTSAAEGELLNPEDRTAWVGGFIFNFRLVVIRKIRDKLKYFRV